METDPDKYLLIRTQNESLVFKENKGIIFLKSIVKRSYVMSMKNALTCLWLFLSVLNGCRSAVDHRKIADTTAYDIIQQQQVASLGAEESFTINRPSDILRRRLMVEQHLAHQGPASLGIDRLLPLKHWPDWEYLSSQNSNNTLSPLAQGTTFQLTLIDAITIGAKNNFDYQMRKEDIFRAALDLDLERNDFRNIFHGQVEHLYIVDQSGKTDVEGYLTTGDLSLGKAMKGGAKLTAAIAVDLANLLTMDGASSLGIVGDASISIPLLRGAGKHIMAEPLTQAERNVVYAIYTFERYKRILAVNIAGEYLSVLTRLDQVVNNEENYRSLITSARRARRRADAGRQTEIQVDQAVQDELRARDRWITAQEAHNRSLDNFKMLMGLPPDALIELDREELAKLKSDYVDRFSTTDEKHMDQPADLKPSNGNEPVELPPPNYTRTGPLELEYAQAIEVALAHRLDLQTAIGKVYDAQRKAIVLADALGAELTLLGSAGFGESRSIGTATLDDANLRMDEGLFSSLLTLDLPLERTYERHAYRKGLIDMERAIRDVQKLEDNIKFDVRSKLGALLTSRESIGIQTKAVHLAQKRVNMTELFLEAGRTQIRDVLEAKSALLSAQNALTSAVANYRIAELELQKDMDVLKVDENGLCQEYLPENVNPEKIHHVEK